MFGIKVFGNKSKNYGFKILEDMLVIYQQCFKDNLISKDMYEKCLKETLKCYEVINSKSDTDSIYEVSKNLWCISQDIKYNFKDVSCDLTTEFDSIFSNLLKILEIKTSEKMKTLGL
jgi:hypothetical protein